MGLSGKQYTKSPSLSILLNTKNNFIGRKLGILVSDGADAQLITNIHKLIEKKKAQIEIIAPTIQGVKLDNGNLLSAHKQIVGGPSVLYDAVAIVVSEESIAVLKDEPSVRDFIADAFAHNKFIAYTQEALPLIQKAGIADDLDDGCFLLTEKNVSQFLHSCDSLRYWQRELK